MRAGNKLLLISIILVFAVIAAGCLCCGATSKFKKSVTALQFPSQFTVGGKTFTKTYTHDYLTMDKVKERVQQSVTRLGGDVNSLSSSIDGWITLAGIKEARSFNYKGPSGSGDIRGFAAKSDSPAQLTTGYEAGKTAISGTQDVTTGGDVDIGDGGSRWTTVENGKRLYVVVCRYSNMLVYAQSYDSYDAAEAAARMAIKAIDDSA
jgi:hypothetical protein